MREKSTFERTRRNGNGIENYFTVSGRTWIWNNQDNVLWWLPRIQLTDYPLLFKFSHEQLLCNITLSKGKRRSIHTNRPSGPELKTPTGKDPCKLSPRSTNVHLKFAQSHPFVFQKPPHFIPENKLSYIPHPLKRYRCLSNGLTHFLHGQTLTDPPNCCK